MQIREVADQENNVLGGAPPPARAMIDRVTLLGGLAWPCWGEFGTGGIATNGIFGPNTEMAVKNFQTLVGLPSGIVDAKTWMYLWS